MTVLQLLFQTLSTFVSIYLVLLFIRILLTWFPNIDFYNPPFSVLAQLTDPYLNIFRRVIPPLGGLDFSAILAILVLQIIQSAVLPSVAQLFVNMQTSLIG